MDYKKKYKEALERARKCWGEYNELVGAYENKGVCEEIFPELRESEDEKIRKELKTLFLGWINGKSSPLLAEPCNRYIAWLEEQGEHKKFRDSIQVGDKVTKNEDGVLVNLSQLSRVAKKDEKQGEQKSTDKVEPKFKVGDTIRHTIHKYITATISDIKDGEYILSNSCGTHMPIEWQNNYELAEQKPASFEIPLLEKFKQAVYNCAWGKVTCKSEGETQDEYAERWAEQLLSIVRDWADDYIDSREDTIRRGAYDKAIKEKKPAEWSKEDETNLTNIIIMLKEGASLHFNKKDIAKGVPWLKDLKARVQPKMEWSEDDSPYFDDICELLMNILHSESRNYNMEAIKKDLNWLKSLKDRVLPQPKQEWNEDTQQWIDAIVKDYEELYDADKDHRATTQAKISVLKSLKERVQPQPQSHWKPTEEHLKGLRRGIKNTEEGSNAWRDLKDLYEQLKVL